MPGSTKQHARAARVALLLAACLVSIGARSQAQVWGSNTGPSGDAFTRMATDPTVPGLVYAWNGAQLRRSTDAGQSWQTPASSGLSNYGRILIDASRGGALFAAVPGQVLRSDDHAESWTLVGTVPSNGGLVGINGSTGVLFAADAPDFSADSLYRSADGGATWSLVQSFPIIYGSQDTASFIQFDPQTPGLGYVVTWFSYVWKTTDDGVTWKPTQTLTPTSGIGGRDTHFPTAFAIDPSDHALYVSTTTYFYRSTNGGRTWAKLSLGGPALAVDPSVSGSLYRGDGFTLWHSVDGGKRWIISALGLTGVPTAIAADQHTAGLVYVATEVSFNDTSSNGVFVQTCGNGHTDPGEVCDDGNTADGDGCSGRCRVERYLAADEQECVNADNVAGAAVAKAELADDLRCFKAGAAGSEPDPQACTAADANHKVERAQAKLAAKDAAVCASVAPPYAHTSPTVAGDAAATEARNLINDLFGSDLDTAQIKTATDAVGAACQKEVLIASQNLLKQYIASFVSCKKKRLAGKLWPTIGATADLEDCWDEPDTKSLSRASDRLNYAEAGACSGVNVTTAFPNGQANPIQGAYYQVRCRACRILNRMDGLNRDCDAFDDGDVGSCAN